MLVLYEEQGMGSRGGRGETGEKKRYKKNEKENSLKRGDGTVGMRYPRRGRARE